MECCGFEGREKKGGMEEWNKEQQENIKRNREKKINNVSILHILKYYLISESSIISRILDK